jgi:acetyl-CoA carboxylase carboxyl transferase subunit alpha
MTEQLLPEPRGATATTADVTTAEPTGAAVPNAERIDAAWKSVQLARHPQRPRTLDLIARIFDDFYELHGDRAFRDDPAIVGGPALLEGRSVMVIGHQKGTDTESNIYRNFGSPYPEGFRKAQRMMRLADKLGLPVITFLDTAGAFPGPEAEERGQAEAIASSIKLMIGLQVPIVTVVLGEGGSGGALAIGVGDEVLALENAVYSVISPEGCASILWRSAEQAPLAAAALRMTAEEQRRLGVVDDVIPEPPGGAQTVPVATARAVKAAVLGSLRRLGALDTERLLTNRYARLRAIGAYRETAVAPRVAPEAPSLRRRIGRLLHMPGVPRRPRWSEVWPSGDDANDGNDTRGDV